MASPQNVISGFYGSSVMDSIPHQRGSMGDTDSVFMMKNSVVSPNKAVNMMKRGRSNRQSYREEELPSEKGSTHGKGDNV